jgi:hypothetical protein
MYLIAGEFIEFTDKLTFVNENKGKFLILVTEHECNFYIQPLYDSYAKLY